MVGTVSNTIPSETMLKRLPVLFFSFFISREADESLGNICFLSDSPKFSTESHFPPQRAKHLLHLDAITENENEKDQPPQTQPNTDTHGGKGISAASFPPLLFLSLSLCSISFHSPPPENLPFLFLTASTSHRKAQLCCEKQRILHDVSVQHKDGHKIALLSLSWMVSSG